MSRMLLVLSFSTLVVLYLLVETVAGQESETARIVGRITASYGWDCLPGVTVTLRRHARFDRLEHELKEELSEEIAYRTETDENGHFEIVDIAPLVRYALVATLPGWSTGVVRRLYLSPGEERVVDLGLSIGITTPISELAIEGRVVDGNGDPVDDATVILSAALNPEIVHRTRTDGEGRFRITVLDRALFVLFAVKPERGPVVESAVMSLGPHGPFDGLVLRLTPHPAFDPRRR